ncbi:MAG TPA: pantoate--beta-alanine ligase [Bryobacteraceae bacterium]|jgi:pantoate--beta-alanine ligase|nr:pantoate--beta-alanine ligase [Bryobacteraceae bacterium]
MPEVIAGVEALRERLRRERERSIGLVPTMGALHRGHEKLLEVARRQNDFVVASIFVNPIQFDRTEDLEKYPRMIDEDLGVCENHGVDLVFAPATTDLYPNEQLTFVESPVLGEHLCGAHRPGHFRGVATVVLKLFNVVQPDRAYFGEKDAQQLAIIRRMVTDLNVPVTVVPVATVREDDGLALSSRNKHLTPAQRRIAPVLSRALGNAVDSIERGERRVAVLRDAAQEMFAQYPEARVEYFEFTNPDTLQPVDQIDSSVRVAGAIWLGSTRLIDNMRWPR